jgi:hypothetical protein
MRNVNYLRVTCYLPLEAWELFAKLALESGHSMSGYASGVLHKHLQRATGYEGEGVKPRAMRASFQPSKTLAGALKAQRSALEVEAEKIAAKVRKLDAMKRR